MKPLVLIKFGGSSLSGPDSFPRLARLVIDRRDEDIVLVVSARQGQTDALIAELHETLPGAPKDVLDAFLSSGELQAAALMAGALAAAGRQAEVVPPWLVFRTNDRFGNGEIVKVDADPVRQRLARQVIPVVGGFIGQSSDGRLCTLGRGGSDYSALALGAELGACVELHKATTDGVYSSDPNLHASAQRYGTMSHEEAYELAVGGAKVLQCKAAALAREREVPVWVRPTFGNGPGTQIGNGPTSLPRVD